MTDRSKWLEERKRYITASDAAAVLGKNPYKKPLEVYLDKLGLIPPFEGNAHTRRGVENESKVISAFCATVPSAKNVAPNAALVTSDDYPFLAATPDGFLKYKGKKATLEVKCPAKNWETPPEYYVIQVWVQVLVSGAEGGFLAWSTCPVEPPVRYVYYSLTELNGLYGKYMTTLEIFHNSVLARDLHMMFW